MDISVVIVNYNVKHFLEQCLESVHRATKGLKVEVFVVDNHSVDGSCEMVRERFPWVRLIANTDNKGFSKANNQAIEKSAGEYILLLNPDTVIQEDTLQICKNFMDSEPSAGALGVRMIDGKGNFLPESKRALPTPLVAFYKIFGLSALFPHSRVFGKYHLGYLSQNATHEIEVLAGAFMFVRRQAFDRAGLLDEDFFMYGEDIDLSYRINQAGFKNYYLPDTTIIHYKGESTKKGSINYVLVFYNAMLIFARKHFSRKNIFLFSLLIKLAIYFRAALSISSRIIKYLFLPVLDILFAYSSFYYLANSYEKLRFHATGYFPEKYFTLVIPAYLIVFLFVNYFTGGYERRIKILSVLKGVASSLALLLIAYSLLPEAWRFSRALLLAGSLTTFLAFLSARILYGMMYSDVSVQFRSAPKHIAIIANDAEFIRVKRILHESGLHASYIEKVLPSSIIQMNTVNSELLNENIKVNKIDEIIFCSIDLSAQQIIQIMLSIDTASVDFKIAPRDSISIIGSNSIDTAGDLYIVGSSSLNRPLNKRKKRMFDVVMTVLFLILYPVAVFFVQQKIGFIGNIFRVLSGQLSWVTIHLTDKNFAGANVKQGVLTPFDSMRQGHFTQDEVDRINLSYAKDYRMTTDLKIVVKGFKLLGRKITELR